MIERFVEQHAEMAFHLAFRLCGNVEDAKELVQEAFVRAISRWEHGSQDEPGPIWLQTVLRRLERREDDGLVQSALESLRPDYRAILLLNAQEGLGYEEMAEVLDCPLGTVRSRLNRARACFRKALIVRGQGARL